MDKKTKTHPKKEEDTTGTYVFDKTLGKVVKVSGRIPSVSSKGKGGDFSADTPMPPCGQGSCPSAGTCGMGGMGDF
jgi:hypothetical protein